MNAEKFNMFMGRPVSRIGAWATIPTAGLAKSIGFKAKPVAALRR